MSKDLWPDFDVTSKSSPKTTIEQAGAGLEEKTNGLILFHLYGKEMRPGRKVGHVNAYGDDLEDCLERARHAAAWFAGDLGEESE